MSGGPRSLPARPNLRHLKLEAKRRLAAGEFTALHEAHSAIAREYGEANWSSLKRAVCEPAAQRSVQAGEHSHALTQLRWIVARFGGADQPGWTAPGDGEMREHFDEHFLAELPTAQLADGLAGMAADLRSELVVVAQEPLHARVRLAGLDCIAAAEADPPHRLRGLRAFPLGARITDPRMSAEPPARTLGNPPAGEAEIAADAFGQLGLVGLIVAGGDRDKPQWAIARGWASLDRGEPLELQHRFPALGVTTLVTLTVVLRLIADGRFRLDTRVNDMLRTVRLADGAVTVRELLSHCGGVGSPGLPELLADSVPDLVTLAGGPVVGWGGERGALQPSNGGYAVLGQLIADVTGSPYPDVARQLVLGPLAMHSSSFPLRTADIGSGILTGYQVSASGQCVELPAALCTIPAVGGMWTTAADLVRLGTRWSSLLPPGLAREALVPQTPAGQGGIKAGLAWLLPPSGDVAVQSGSGPGNTASILLRLRDKSVHVTMTSRATPIDQIDDRVRRSWTGQQP